MTYQGTIVYQLINAESKSERLVPYLYQGGGAYVKIWKPNEDMSLKDSLTEYDGKRVCVQGNLNEYEVIIVEQIEEV